MLTVCNILLHQHHNVVHIIITMTPDKHRDLCLVVNYHQIYLKFSFIFPELMV